MKRILYLLLTLVFVLCFSALVFADTDTNMVHRRNSGFEDVTAVKETNLYKLIKAKGNWVISDSLYEDIWIKRTQG